MKRAIDILWLLLLGAFVFAGLPIATFHGDETYHIYTSTDYNTLFIEHRPQDLLVHSLWESDSGYQRLMNGGLTRYAIGLTWHLAGMSAADLPTHGYLFGSSYEENAAWGYVPDVDDLTIFRLSSTLFTALSVAVMFLIGRLYGGRPLAYLVSALYTLNPVILLNGRRAMQEGVLLFFGLLTIYIALSIASRREAMLPVRWRWWLSLIIAGALALASKYSGFVYLIPAYLAIVLPELLRRSAATLPLVGGLVLCAVLTLALFFALSPGLWYDPAARIRDVIQGRFDVIQTQVGLDPGAPTSLTQRAVAIFTQPFMTTVQHYEIAPVAPPDQIARYMESPLNGVQFGTIFGGLLTLLAMFGLVVSAVPRLRLNPSRALAAGLYLWLAVNVAALMVNPLPWQRYYLPLIPVMTLLAGSALLSLIALMRRAPTARLDYA
ncbi:MAG: phospholipid carrier-dependent glycosyltransferase [Anaerolineae bacterium]